MAVRGRLAIVSEAAQAERADGIDHDDMGSDRIMPLCMSDKNPVLELLARR